MGCSVPGCLYEAVFDMASSDDEGRNLQAGHFFYCIYLQGKVYGDILPYFAGLFSVPF